MNTRFWKYEIDIVDFKFLDRHTEVRLWYLEIKLLPICFLFSNFAEHPVNSMQFFNFLDFTGYLVKFEFTALLDMP